MTLSSGGFGVDENDCVREVTLHPKLRAKIKCGFEQDPLLSNSRSNDRCLH